MESRGNSPAYPGGGIDTFGSTLHWGSSFFENRSPLTHNQYRLQNSTFADGMHTFGLIWTPDSIKTYVDDERNIVLDVPFGEGFWKKGNFNPNLDNPWVGACPQAPFDEGIFHTISSNVFID
jgi:hypothetical protein